MKKLLFVTLLLSLNAFAFQNPQIRVCNISHGNFEVYDIEDDVIGHCNLGKASIDTISLMEIRFYDRTTDAVRAFLGNSKKCNGSTITGVNNMRTNELCFYMDGSSIDLETLVKGSDHTDNAKLKAVLTSIER
jgi:hypothetical protein